MIFPYILLIWCGSSKTGGIEVIEKTTIKLDDNPNHIIVKVSDESVNDIFVQVLTPSN